MSYSPPFIGARPVWLAGRKAEKNVMAAFRACFSHPGSKDCTLNVACSSVYRAFVNGVFLGHGPARGPHGHFRVDVWNLDQLLRPGDNVVAIEAVGNNVNSYYTLDQPSFLQAEVLFQGTSLAATGAHGNGFIGRRLKERLQKVLRFSFQRPFTEIWRLRPGWDLWRTSGAHPFKGEELAEQPDKWLIPRRVPHCRFARRGPMLMSGQGQLQTQVAIANLWKDRSRTDIGPKFGGFAEAELETIPSDDWQRTLAQRAGGDGEDLPPGARRWRCPRAAGACSISAPTSPDSSACASPAGARPP